LSGPRGVRGRRGAGRGRLGAPTGGWPTRRTPAGPGALVWASCVRGPTANQAGTRPVQSH